MDEWLWFDVLINPVFLPYWFVSLMREGKLPKMMILAVIIPTILGAVLGATFVVNSSEHAYQKAEFWEVLFFAILLGSLGALIVMSITFFTLSSRSKRDSGISRTRAVFTCAERWLVALVKREAKAAGMGVLPGA